MIPTRKSTILEFTEDGFYHFMNDEINEIDGIKSIKDEYTKYGTIIAQIYFIDEESKIQFLGSSQYLYKGWYKKPGGIIPPFFLSWSDTPEQMYHAQIAQIAQKKFTHNTYVPVYRTRSTAS